VTVTTFDELLKKPGSEKVFLVEIEPSKEINAWTQYSGTIYKHEIGYVDIQSVDENGAAMGYTATVSALSSGTWTFSEGWLYLIANASKPHSKTIVANLKVYYGTDGKLFNDHFYEPFVASVPNVIQSKADLWWGVSITGDGTCSLFNHKANFDEIYESWAWNNKPISVFAGGEQLPYSEYVSIFKGIINDVHLSTNLFDISFTDAKNEWDQDLVQSTFDTVTYPGLDSGDVGKMIPLVWGTVYNMPVTCVTKAYGTATSEHTFKIADTSLHSIDAINQVYVKGNAVTHHSGDTSAAEFKLYTSTFTPGDEITVDIDGYASGSLLENGVDIAREIGELLGVSYDSSTWDTVETEATKTEVGGSPIGLVVNSTKGKAIDHVAEIMKSMMCYFFVNNDGQYVIKAWTPMIPADPDRVNEFDVANFKSGKARESICKVVRAGYRKNWKDDTYSYIQDTAVSVERVFGITNTKTVTTLLSSSTGATLYASRMQLLLSEPAITNSFDSKFVLLQKNIGDRFLLSFRRKKEDRYPDWLNEKLVEIKVVNKNFKTGLVTVTTEDLREIGISVGRWTVDEPQFPDNYGGGAAYPWDKDWSPGKKAYAKAYFGYWCDDDGFVDPEDGDSYMCSRWW